MCLFFFSGIYHWWPDIATGTSDWSRHHFMLDVYKKDLKGRKQIEETIMASHGLKAQIKPQMIRGVGDDEVWGLQMFFLNVSGT